MVIQEGREVCLQLGRTCILPLVTNSNTAAAPAAPQHASCTAPAPVSHFWCVHVCVSNSRNAAEVSAAKR